MTQRKKLLYGIGGVYLLGVIVFVVLFGAKGHKNEAFLPQEEFHLLTWVKLLGPIQLDKGVLYLFIAGAITIGIMVWVSKRMTMRPNRVQTAVEAFYNLSMGMTRENMDPKMAAKWFPVICTLFIFILVSNLIGYIPLPVNSGESFHAFGLKIPSFQIFAADTNVGFPLTLALMVFLAFNIEGIRAHGFIGYVKSLVPKGVEGGMKALIFPLEILSNFLRLLSLTIRLWANLLAGHLLIAFMAGDLAVLLGLQVLGWITLPFGIAIFLFEAVLIASLQAFIFAILAAIYLGGAVSHH
ncbi:MAG: F-type H+-transporting ATPase subunit a [Solirubrobacteraceae bacterium]|jgi:F-type H+-transporting ATPase subunit a|nr:F-type H+-transporting ATPase subunit a [Solirubrobacteraceae bacterium]MEA2302011.1 F-type H+-transporting ATPase subunit a [Solirubrobacteraceae bacterium]MEA2356617.1 F-type H+-transporting ATPase subunit a [Solirubrobacteraceae bacterium]